MIKTPFVSHPFSVIIAYPAVREPLPKLPVLTILNHKATHDASAEDKTLALFFILSFLYDERVCPVRYEKRWLDADICDWRMLPRFPIICAKVLTAFATF